MKKCILRTISLAVTVMIMIALFAGCGNSSKGGKLEYAYFEPVVASKIDMDNYNGMDLSGLDMFRFGSLTLDTYSDGTYVLRRTSGLALNTIEGQMGGTSLTCFGTFTVKPVSEDEDNTEYIYELSVPTRVISAKDVTYLGSSCVDSDAAEDVSVIDLLNNGQYYSEITVDREFCTIIDKVESAA